MDSQASFFWTILILQAVFSAAVAALVVRRWPGRATIYRLVAPAALPIMMLVMVGYGMFRVRQMQGLAFDATALGPFALAYFILWVIGVLIASAMIRLFRR